MTSKAQRLKDRRALRKGGRKDPVRRDDRAPATSQTRAKIQNDVVLKLFKSRALTQAQYDAALEIRRIVELVETGKSAVLETVDHSGGQKEWFEFISDDDLKIWRQIYVPWRREILGSRPMPLTGNQCAKLLDDFVLHNSDVIACANTYGISPTMVVRRIVIALSLWEV